jgi:hypothetical protein
MSGRTGAEPGELAWLPARWWQDWDLGWDEECVAVHRAGGAMVFAPAAGTMNQALKLDRGMRLLGENLPVR